MNLTVLKAIFKRDFVSYFSNATGYVFICVFVILSSLATFWPPEFFTSNLANLDQLSHRMPFILLVFIPAITMSIWAEERRRGTDELLLTLPATDSDVVIGKYLAGVAIFTVSLLFSMASILLIFRYGLGEPDLGLFLCTYFGYWLVGLAMLATGMVASFLTSNLTVGFILGMLFNAPQALASFAKDAIAYIAYLPSGEKLLQVQWFHDLAHGVVSSFSAFEGFSDFSRGVVSLSGAVHFLGIVGLMLYLSMVLIGRRHWSGGDDGQTLWWHYIVRGAALFLLVGGVNMMLRNNDSIRIDTTAGQINSLSPSTRDLVSELGDQKDTPAVRIDAYVSPQVPSEFAGQKRELLSALDELRSIAGGKIVVAKHEIENFSEEATRAERTFGIEARAVNTRVRGAAEQEEIFLGAAISCGLDKVVIPFFDRGIPVEYELVRSITTVAQRKRKRVGVLKTDVPLFSSFSMQGQMPESQLVAELKKQYDVTEVDPANPITDSYDVLLAVQPSSLSPEAFANFVEVVKRGQATAIFEDPLPVAWQGVVGTDEPKQQGGGMMGMLGGGGRPQPKGDMQQLWQLVGASVSGSKLIWQDHNPYRQDGVGSIDWIFVDTNSGAEQPFNPKSDITSGLNQALFLYAGHIRSTPGAKTKFVPLAATNMRTGTLGTREAQAVLRRMMPASQADALRAHTKQTYVLAAKITGKVKDRENVQLDETIDDAELRAEANAEANVEANAEANAPDEGATPAETAAPPAESAINLVVVSDIDCLMDDFFAIRAIGDSEQLPVDWRFQNVTLVLNILDELAGDSRYIDLRKRTRDYRTLTGIETATEEYRANNLKDQDKANKKATEAVEGAQLEYRKSVAKIENRTDLDPAIRERLKEREEIRQARIRDVRIAAAQQELSRTKRQNERDLMSNIRNVQDFYKFAAVIVPPILPILLALWVYFRRRAKEQEGVSRTRLRYAQPNPPPAQAS